jgi:dTDP-4-amino-4,6-dideoxygalactose transaminase
MSTRIPITRPVFGAEECAAVQQPLATGWVVQGPFVQRFEERFAAFVGSPSGIATTSCTTALHLALTALGVRPGDEVIVPAFTWVSTPNVVEYLGAKPVFCDIDLATFNIDVDQAASLVNQRTVGIIPVHLFGLCADMPGVGALAGRNGLWVVEDAACGFGARIDGRHAGAFGDAGCFSFHPRKAITTGEGGMLTTGRADVAALARSLRDHGASRSDLARHESASAFLLSEYPRLGYNYRMTDLQGALGCAQMDRGDWILAGRRRVAARYAEALSDLEWIEPPTTPSRFEHGYQAYVCLFQPEPATLDNVDALHRRRNDLMARLERDGIATRQGTHAAALVEYYASRYGFRPNDFPRAWIADRLTLALPLYPQMTDGEQDEVCGALSAACAAESC